MMIASDNPASVYMNRLIPIVPIVHVGFNMNSLRGQLFSVSRVGDSRGKYMYVFKRSFREIN